MPSVKIASLESVLKSGLIAQLAVQIPAIVANALTVPGTEGELQAHEIEVEIVLFRDFEIHGHNDIEITVLANEYPKRLANLDERRKSITREVRTIIQEKTNIGRKLNGFVWVLLAPGSFEEL